MDNVDNVDKEKTSTDVEGWTGQVPWLKSLRKCHFQEKPTTYVEKIVEKKNPQPKSPTNR